MLKFRVDSVSNVNPIKASLPGLIFFVCIGFLLTIMMKVDIPGFKFNSPDKINTIND